MKKIAFIVPYYGAWPSYFPDWLYTAGYLKEQQIDFWLVTDLSIPFPLPENVKIKKMTLGEVRNRAQKLFDFSISLDTPYKLCDYRPCYGELFQDLLASYDFWGHCDIDLLWGDVRYYITDEILEQYDKIQYLGHFVLYRNIKRVNELYRKKGGVFGFKEVFSSPNYYSFDEHPGMALIALANGIPMYVKTNQVDISPRQSRITVQRVENYQYQVVYWEKGHIYRSYIDNNGIIQRDEFMYTHFQQRKLKSVLATESDFPDSFCIQSDGLYKLNGRIDVEVLRKISGFRSDEIDKEEIKTYRRKKIRKFFSCTLKEKVIWVRIRIGTRKANKTLSQLMKG